MGFFKKLFRNAGRSAGFGGGGDFPNPMIAARPYLDQIGPTGQQYLNPWLQGGQNTAQNSNAGQVGLPYYKPFIQEGQRSQGIANTQYDRMAQDPNEFLNSIMRGYSPSEGYKFKEKELLRAAQNSAAQGGFSGTRNDQIEQSSITKALLDQGMQEHLANILGIQSGGLEGQERNIGRGFNASGQSANLMAQGEENRIGRDFDREETRLNRGFQASSQLADYLGSNLGQQAALAYQGALQGNVMRADRRNARNKFITQLAGSFMGGG